MHLGLALLFLSLVHSSPGCRRLARTAAAIVRFVSFQARTGLLPRPLHISNLSVAREPRACKLKLDVLTVGAARPLSFGYYFFKDSFSDSCALASSPLIRQLSDLFAANVHLKASCDLLWAANKPAGLQLRPPESKVILLVQKKTFVVYTYVLGVLIAASLVVLVYQFFKCRHPAVFRRAPLLTPFPTSHLVHKQPLFVDVSMAEEGDRRSEFSSTRYYL